MLSFLRKDFLLQITLKLFVFILLIFLSCRIFLFLKYPSLFNFPVQESINVFLNGFRFDMCATAIIFTAPFLVLNIPLGKKWFSFWLYFTGALICALTLFLISDIIYFPEVNRHIAQEIIQIGSDIGFLFTYTFKAAIFPFICFLCFCVGVFWSLHKMAKKYFPTKIKWWHYIVKFLILALFCLFSIRGHFGGGKSFSSADVYKYVSSPKAAALANNAVFTSVQAIRNGQKETENNYPFNDAVKNTQALFIAKNEIVLDGNYPLLRQVKDRKEEIKDINFVVVLMESWAISFIDSLGGGTSGNTPIFDDIVKNGVVFENAYAIGHRSIDGFQGVFASIPTLEGVPNLGNGLEMLEPSAFFANFSNKGFYTFFAQTSLRHSFRLCSLASYLGAGETYGWEDEKPELLPYIEEAPYGYDYEAFMLAADKIKARKQNNFVGAVFTGITHTPYTVTLEKFQKYPPSSEDNEYRNTLFYSDWSLGQFLQRAKEDGWFDNTIFIFVADHSRAVNADNVKDKFHIPLVLYAPKILKPENRKYIVSQFDIVPTIYKMAGLTTPYTAFGKDLFDDSTTRVAFIQDGDLIGLATKDGAIRHNRKQLVSVEPFNPTFKPEDYVPVLLSLDKTASKLLKSNKWYKNEK